MPPPGPAGPTKPIALALVAVAGLAFALRSVGLEHAFLPDGTVVLQNGDGAYHARLAHYSFVHFPAFLRRDWYLAGPLGGAVPWPPGFDLAIAAAARMLGADGVDRVLAWSGPVLGTLSMLAVYAAARALGAPLVALAAALSYASFGSPMAYAVVAGGDHHCWVGFLGAAWLALALRFAAGAAPAASIAAPGVGLALVRAAMLVGWSGSPLYLGIADGTLLLACVLPGDVRRLRGFGLGVLGTLALVAPFVWSAPTPAEGAFSSINLSNLHLLLLAALAVLALAAAEHARRRPAASPPARFFALVLAGFALVAALAAVPAIRAQLVPALRFLTLEDAAGAGTVEQRPLFPLFGRKPMFPATVYFGGWAYAVPLAPLLALWAARDPARRLRARLLAAWTAPFAVLATTQIRYGNDVAAPAAVCFALALGELARVLRERLRLGRRASTVLVAALAVALLVPSLRDPLAHAGPSLAFVLGTGAGGGETPLDANGTLVRFAQLVRAATPETPGFDDDGVPDWGLVCIPSIGHTLRYYARRPVAADNFWDKFPSYEQANAFLSLTDETQAVASAQRLRARFAVTMPWRSPSDSLNARLQLLDGRAAEGRPRLEHFRLLTEGPRGGVALVAQYGVPVPPGSVPYKLFEIVPGAVLEVQAPPGGKVSAEVLVETPVARRFPYVAHAVADANGVARLRVPYATRTPAPAHPTGPWRIRVDDAPVREVDVGDADVTSGAVVPVPEPAL